MPLARGDKEYKIPTAGINTEANILDFPEDAVSDISNIELKFDPVSLRPRLGQSETEVTPTPTSTTALEEGATSFSWYLWEKCGGEDNVNLLCVHIGSHVVFLDANTDEVDTAIAGKISLDSMRSQTAKGTLLLAERSTLQFSRAKEALIIN